MKAVSATPDIGALGNLGGAFMHPMHWLQGLQIASIELASVSDLQPPDLLSLDRIALAAVGVILGVLYFQKVGAIITFMQQRPVVFLLLLLHESL